MRKTLINAFFVIMWTFLGIVFAEEREAIGDSVAISISVSSCPMMFVIDSLARHPELPGFPEQDTFFLNYIIHGASYMPLEWSSTYLVGDRREIAGVYAGQGIMVYDSGCVRLDFELSTFAYDTLGASWWQPSNTIVPSANKYVLRAIATGINTPKIFWIDTTNFMGPESYYYLVTNTPREIKDSAVTIVGTETTAICCFYSRNLYGYNVIPTIDASGVGLRGRTYPLHQKAFFLHLALTTPAMFGSDADRLTGIIVLRIQARPRM